MSSTIPMVGKNSRKLLVYSQASVTKVSECPTRMLPWMGGNTPPIESVGSVSPSRRIWESIEVVVVFPCVPLTATETLYSFMSCPKRVALVRQGMPSLRARKSSSLSSLTAAV